MELSARAAVVRQFGGPEVIGIEEVGVPELRPGQIRVAVRTGGLNPVDARMRSGAFGGGVPMHLGTEFAGIVMASTDPRWKRGDEVIGWGVRGADAEIVTTVGEQLHAKPAGLDWALAGGLSGVGQTALTTLDRLALSVGDTVVVHGAAGGVGTVLTQLAVGRGVRVIGTAGEANLEYLRSLGAVAITYGDGLADRLAAAAEAPIDASIDLAGTSEAGDIARQVLAAGGKAVTLVPETMSSHGIELVRTQPNQQRMAALLAAVEAGVLTLPVEAITFDNIVEAHRRLDAKRARGKVVLDLSDNPHLVAAAAGAGQEA